VKQQHKADIDWKENGEQVEQCRIPRMRPAEVVAKDQQRLSELRTDLGIAAQIARVTALKDQ